MFQDDRNGVPDRWCDLRCFTPIGQSGQFCTDCEIPKLELIEWMMHTTQNGVKSGELRGKTAIIVNLTIYRFTCPNN